VRLIGRVGNVVDLSDLTGRRWYVGTLTLGEAVSDIRQVPSFPYPRFYATRQSDPEGSEKFLFQVEATNPRAYDRKAVEYQIAERLRTLEPMLDIVEHANKLRVVVELVDKNALSMFYRLYPGR
jgi:hypothetical protein